jgi:hypothetical protein
VLSFVLYAKPVETLHIVGGAVFIGSVLISMKLKTGKKKPKAPAAGASTGGAVKGDYVSVPVSDGELVDPNPNSARGAQAV